MKVVVFGTSYVGLTHAAVLAEAGHEVCVIGRDQEKLLKLREGITPIVEPGLPELIKANRKRRRLFFDWDGAWAIRESNLIFIAVGTPPKRAGSVDTSQIEHVARRIGEVLDGGEWGYKVLVNKSTAPVGTVERIARVVRRYYRDFDLASNPEFLRQGSAVADSQRPDRIVIGVEARKARELLRELYEPFDCPKVICDIRTAETIKYAANAFLATSISFANEIAAFCERVGADVESVVQALRLDERIGAKAFLKPGPGYGGSCLPKDVKGLLAQAKSRNLRLKILAATDQVNEEAKRAVVRKIRQTLGRLRGRRLAIWGVAFKAGTDDVRESAALAIVPLLLDHGAKVAVYDPRAEAQARLVLDSSVSYHPDPLEAAKEADALLILTEEEKFTQVDLAKLRKALKQPYIFDTRNILDPAAVRKAGFSYSSTGRP